MRVRLRDRAGTLPRRAALSAFAAVLIVSVFFDPPFFSHPAYGLLTFGGLLFLAAPWLIPRPRTRVVELRSGRGVVELVGGIFGRKRRIGAWVTGVRVARAAEGVSVVVAQRFAPPLLLETIDEHDARAIRAALGPAVGAVIAWPIDLPWTRLLEILICAAGLVLWPLYYTAATRHDNSLKGVFGVPALVCVVAAGVLRLARVWRGPAIELGDEGLRFGATGAPERLLYRDMDEVTVTPAGLSIRVDSTAADAGRVAIALPGLGAAEREHLAAHLVAASRASRGTGEPTPRDATAALLARAEGEVARDWLARLDDLARRGDPYRDARLDRAAVLAVLHDEASPDDLRAGAARVLARLDGQGGLAASMVEPALHAEAARWTRIALDEDVDRAGEALDELGPAFQALRTR